MADEPQRVKWKDASWEGRSRRVATWLFLAFATWFIVSTVTQIAQDVLVAGTPLADGDCRTRLVALTAAVERAAAVAARESEADRVRAQFQASLAPEWNGRADAETACKVDANSAATFIEVLRLREASERSLVRGSVEYGGLRRSLQGRLETR